MRTATTIVIAGCIFSFATIALAQAERSESALWNAIQKLTQQDRSTATGDAWYENAREDRLRLLENIRLSQVLYPGGAHRDELIALELQARFEVAIMDNGDFTALQQRVAELLRNPVSRFAKEEAAYWQLQIDSHELTGVSADFDLSRREDARIERVAEFMRTYPESARVPFLVREIFLAREGLVDAGELKKILSPLVNHHPDHGLTRELTARLRVHESIGEAFRVQLPSFRGRSVLVCIIDTRMPRTGRFLRDVENFAKEKGFATHTIDRAAEERETKEPDSQPTSRPRSHELGIYEYPTLIVLDEEGKLRAVAGVRNWNAVLHRLFPTHPGSPQAESAEEAGLVDHGNSGS